MSNRFERYLKTKLAETQPLATNEQVSGEQQAAVPELLQPEEGGGHLGRGATESMTPQAEQGAQENRVGHLKDAFDNFESGRAQTRGELDGLLAHYDKNTISSSTMAQKLGSVQWNAFSDELSSILR